VRRKALMRRFGSLKAMRAASFDEIAEVPGIGPHTAAAIVSVLTTSAPTSGVNVTTGEILDNDGEP